jgi:hypothetical protein
MTSPYSAILSRLLESVDGSVAVGFADYEGESVDIQGPFDEYLHRVHLAYQGIVLTRLQALHATLEEPLARIYCTYQNFQLVIQPLQSGYFLVLTLQRNSNLYQANKQLELAARELNQDL